MSDYEGDPHVTARAFACGEEIYINVTSENEQGRSFELSAEGRPWGANRRIYNPACSYAKFINQRLSEAQVEGLAQQLADLVLQSGNARGRKVARAAGDWLFVVKWPVPFWWEGGFAANPNDMATILALVDRAIGQFHHRTPLAIWFDGVFELRGAKCLLNDAAKDLLGLASFSCPSGNLSSHRARDHGS